MAKIRLEVTKNAEIRFISHLDYARAIERAIRRAKLPAAYSEGFNPHMKIAFASALAVGITSTFEYMDLELKQEIPVDIVIEKLVQQLPPGINVHNGKFVPERSAALMSIVNLASYTISFTAVSLEVLTQLTYSIADFNKKNSIIYTRKSLKGTKEIEIKDYLAKDIHMDSTNQDVTLFMDIKIMSNGSIKPGEVLEALITAYDIPLDGACAVINRSGLYIETDTKRLTPLEVNQ